MTKNLSLSPDRFTFQINKQLEKLESDPGNEDLLAEIEFYKSSAELSRDRMQDPEWRVNNMEYDLLTTDWILGKVRASEGYAQNLYAAICNNDFIKNDTWPLLKDERWSASWRHAGGIIADMLQKGDYIDWYCSGIRADFSEEELNAMESDEQERFRYIKNNFVSESVVTDEIREDLLKLGWIVIDDEV